MEWARVKNILIVLFLIVNIFLFFAYVNSAYLEKQEEQKVIQDISQVLAGLDVEVDSHIIPHNSKLLYPARVEYNEAQEEKIFCKVLGDASVTKPGGGKILYEGAYGTAILRRGGSFEMKLHNMRNIKDEDTARKNLKKIAHDLKIKVREQDIVVTKKEGKLRATAENYISNVVIFNSKLSCEFSDQNEGIVTGGRISERVTVMRGSHPRAISDLLLELVQYLKQQGENCKKIEKIESGYTVDFVTGGEGGGTQKLTPIWKIRVDGRPWAINAMTGKIMNLE